MIVLTNISIVSHVEGLITNDSKSYCPYELTNPFLIFSFGDGLFP